MEISFVAPDFDYMLRSIMDFQSEDESAFWSEPLYGFYPQLDRKYALSLPFPERRRYIERTLRAIYGEIEGTLGAKAEAYSRRWDACKGQITAALSDAFNVDCAGHFNDLVCCVSMNPIGPRFLREHRFEVFYLNSENGAVGVSIHELIHFVWFYVWQRVFEDSFDEYERPSLKWILSEMVVESVMRDERLSSINPYFPREHGGCIYPYFFDMMVDGKPILDTLDELYRRLSIEDFMRAGFTYCTEHEAEIRAHILRSEARL